MSKWLIQMMRLLYLEEIVKQIAKEVFIGTNELWVFKEEAEVIGFVLIPFGYNFLY